jgi:hypothetical protein
MRTVTCVPDTSLMNSMRSMGYELKTAIADIIDNSITAQADIIDVRYHDEGQRPFIAIIDNGEGMDAQTAINAMRLGDTSREQRGAANLGRFGLGLKTASLSQARSLLVSTRHRGKRTTLRWDLDRIKQSGDWSLEMLDEQEAVDVLPRAVRHEFWDRKGDGTCVLWRNLDKLEALAGKSIRDFDRQMDEVRDYVALVFHRFLHPYPSDEGVHQIRICINGSDVPAVDPFLTQSVKTHSDPPQRLAGTDVMLQAVTLPQINHLNKQECRLLELDGKAEHNLLNTQGFYIYRSYRLISWGNWFRMARVCKRLQRYRVRVDIPNSMDTLWGLDVKKSRAVPPLEIRQALRKFMKQFTSDPSAQATRRNARRRQQDELAGLWKIVQDDNGRYGLELDDDSPIIQNFASLLSTEQRSSFAALRRLLAETVPLGALADQMGSDFSASTEGDFISSETDRLRSLAQMYWVAIGPRFSSAKEFAQRASALPEFSSEPHAYELLLEAAKESDDE